MNISTSALLNTLMTKVDGTLKAKIEKLSVDGKVDLSAVVKNKSIQTLLSGLFKDISTGTKNKTEVMSLLENSKQSLKFKNISTEIKETITLLKTQAKNTPEMEKLTSTLKNSLIDIKNIDEKILKSTFINSGVFLESKLAKSNLSVSNNLKNLLNQINDTTKILQTIEKPTNSSVGEIKKDVISAKLENIPSDVKNTIKQMVSSILQKIELVQGKENKVETQLDTLKKVVIEIKVLEEKITKSEIKNDIGTNLKELVNNVKNNLLKNSSVSLNKTFVVIKEQLENLKSDTIDEIKTDVKKVETQIKLLNNEKNVEVKTAVTKELTQQITKIISKIDTGNINDLLKNNLGIMKNISGDLKNLMLQIKETIELQNNAENVSKELKNNVDKVLSQIDYYQLSSYASNSSHSYVSFLQDDIEDMDIKFNNENNDEFSCLIHLSLKEKGDLKILLQLDKKSGININIGVEQDEFKSMIQNALQTLRVKINSLGLSIVSLNIFDLKEELQKINELKAYENSQNLDFGVDIKV